MYHVMCHVSGGVTGTREALLKDGDSSRPKEFETREEAEAEVAMLSRNGVSRYSSARFRYWVVPA